MDDGLPDDWPYKWHYDNPWTEDSKEDKMIIPDWYSSGQNNHVPLPVINKMVYPLIKNLEFECDRGIDSWKMFASDIANAFPNVEIIHLNQNYSCDTLENFYKFIESIFSRNLTVFVLQDSQSKFIDDLKKQNLFNCMSENSVILIRLDASENVRDINVNYKEDYNIITNGTKHIVYYNVNDEPYEEEYNDVAFALELLYKYKHEERNKQLKKWEKATSSYQLCKLMQSFISSEQPSPHYYGWLGDFDYETPSFLNKLRTINAGGILTDNSQPGFRDESELLRGYLNMYLPIVNLEVFLSKLKHHNIFVSITTSNGNCQDSIDHNYSNNIWFKRVHDKTVAFLLSFPQNKDNYNINDIDELWKPHVDKINTSQGPLVIPLTLEHYDGSWHTYSSTWKSFVAEDFPEFLYKNGFNNIKFSFKERMVEVCLIDKQWDDSDPDYIFDIIIDMLKNIIIDDIEFN